MRWVVGHVNLAQVSRVVTTAKTICRNQRIMNDAGTSIGERSWPAKERERERDTERERERERERE